jgi:1-acyl-sn-glycerol-3-phosphate acyltransferase
VLKSNPMALDAISEVPLPQSFPKKTLLSYLMLAPFLLVFFGVLILMDLVQRFFAIFLPSKHHHSAFILNYLIKFSLRLLGTSFEIKNKINLPRDRPYIIVSNHQSMFDISILYTAFKNHHPRFISKKELSKWIPGVSICLRASQAAIIDRKNRQQAIPEIKALGKRMTANNFAAVIFPEGTRARDGVMKRFRPGGLLSLIDSAPSAAVIPVAIEGSWMLTYNTFGPIPLGVKVSLSVGETIEPKNLAPEKVVEQCERRIAEMLKEMR